MSILGGGNILKLPEHLLSKGEQNKDTGLALGRVIICSKYVNESAKDPLLAALIEFTENQQMVIGGKSRLKYADVIKSWNEQNSFNPNPEKK